MDRKLCFVGNIAALYRIPIYKLIDSTWDCDWYFGQNTTDIKDFGVDVLNSISMIKNIPIKGNWYWQFGISKLIWKKKYSKYLIVGDLYSLSTWLVLIQRRLFFPKKRIYLWTHGWYGREGFIKKIIKRLFFCMSDMVLTYGNYAKEIAINQGFKKEKVVAIHNSLDHNYQIHLRKTLKRTSIYKDHFKNTEPVLLFIGRLTKVKQLDMLISSLLILKQRDRRYNLVLIGDGVEKERLQRQVLELGISDRVWFYGACYDDIKNAELIYNADLCVAPGNVGLTAMHTMVFGTPVLTHDDLAWQMPEFEAIIPGQTGAFFKRNNLQSLMDAICRWFNLHGSDREIVRRACYEEIDKNWTPEFQLDVLKKVLDN